jgi:carbon-monoxide dehydrogenase medium subunit
MKPAAFDYLAPSTLDEALQALAAHGQDASVIAGGQSLMPMLAFRLLEPRWLIDLNRIEGLNHIRIEGQHLHIGALTRHAQVEHSPLIAQHLPLLSLAMPHIAHVAIRQRGSIGGSVCLADPAAELPACMVALQARMVLQSLSGRREVAADDFFKGLYQTALAPGELLVDMAIPLPAAGTRVAFDEFSRRHGDYAMAGLAACAHAQARSARLVFSGCGDKPARALRAEALLIARGPKPSYETLRAAIDADLHPEADLQAQPDTKRHLATVLLQRAWDHL